MKRFALSFILIFSALAEVFAQTNLPEQCKAFYPEILQTSVVLKESDARKLLKSSSLGQRGSVRDKRFWVVYSDRDNNTTYTAPGGTEKFRTLSLNDRLRVAQIKDGYALVYDEPMEDIAYPMISQRAESMGWIPVDKLLVWHSCPANEAGIYNKALLCVNLDKQRDSNLGKVYGNPDDRSDYTALETNMNFYYVMKREGDLSLLARSHTLDGTSDVMLLGWVAEQSYVAWNQRSCLEPTWEKGDVEYFAEEGIKVNIYKEPDLMQRATTLNFKTRQGGERDRYLYRMHPDFLRFPLLDDCSEDLYNCSAFVTAGGSTFEISNDDDGALAQSEKQLRDLTYINIGLVIDGTTSMEEYYSAVYDAIGQGVKFFGDRYHVEVGAVIYRDYADGQYVTELCKLTRPDNPELEQFLSNGGVYGIKSHRLDRTYTEALYKGIDVALDQLGFKKGQTNILLVVGDCGNDRKDTAISSDDLVRKLVDKNVHIMGFQARRKPHDAYELFSSQIMNLMQSSLSQKYTTLSEDVKVRLTETKDGYTLENNAKSNIYVGTYNFPELGSQLELTKLSEMIQDAISYCAESAEDRISVLASFNVGFKRNSKSVNTDMDIDDKWLRHVLGENYDAIKNSNSLLAFQGYVRKEDSSKRKYFKPVVFISSDELNALITRLAPVDEAAVAQTNDREPYVRALTALVQTMAPEEYTDDVIGGMNYKQIMAKITGLNEAADALKGYTIQQIASHRAVSQAEYAKLVDDFKRKFKKLQSIKSSPYKYTRTFNGLKYYWLPIEDLP